MPYLYEVDSVLNRLFINESINLAYHPTLKSESSQNLQYEIMLSGANGFQVLFQ